MSRLGRGDPAKGAGYAPLQVPAKCPIQDGGQQGVEFGGGFRLKAFERVHFGLKDVEVGDDAALCFP